MAQNKWIIRFWCMGLLWMFFLADPDDVLGVCPTNTTRGCSWRSECNTTGGCSCCSKCTTTEGCSCWSECNTKPTLGGCQCKKKDSNKWDCDIQNVTHALKVNDNSSLFVAENFTTALGDNSRLDSVIFLQKNNTLVGVRNKWPEIGSSNSTTVQLNMKKWHTEKPLKVYVLFGTNCSNAFNETDNCTSPTNTYGCWMKCLETKTVCSTATYDKTSCPSKENKYIVTVNNNTTPSCINCNNPEKKAEINMELKNMNFSTTAVPNSTGQPLSPAVATTVVSYMSNFALSFNGSSAAFSMGESITGVLVKQKDPLYINEVSFAYNFPNDSFNILDDRNALSRFSRSVTVSKEAFEEAMRLNMTEPFAAVFRFLNLSKDVYNNSVLGDEVIAIEMGTVIKNLTDRINVNFWNMSYNGIPTCYSWNGKGSRPNWTDEGCETVTNKTNITCKCTHMTFFAVLLTPLNETISSSDLNTLTTITRVGCGLSMFFLGIVLFMHFVMRRARSSKSTLILIHLVLAMFLLDFTFLINDLVAKMKNSVGCIIMAAFMHYFMLTTFTWFAMHAFHLCLQLYTGGQIKINHYILKVSITSWVLPSLVGIVLLSIGKYGEDVINTDNVENKVYM